MITLAFIGAGKMASAIVGGLLKNQKYSPSNIACTSSQHDNSGPTLATKTGIHYLPDIATLLETADIVILACKPQQLSELDARLASLAKDKLIVSILAGTPIERLKTKFPSARNIVRAMPNTPGQIGAGITGYSADKDLSESDSQSVEDILGSLGKVITISENQLDALTAISGSGPAYLFEFTAALEAAAEELGLNAEIAKILARQTIIGSAQLLEDTQENPETLRNHVTSPGGTTQAALESMKASGLRTLLSQATRAAKDRSVELSKL